MTVSLIHNWRLLTKCTFELGGRECRLRGSKKNSVCLDYGDDSMWINRVAFQNLLQTGDIKIIKAPTI